MKPVQEKRIPKHDNKIKINGNIFAIPKAAIDKVYVLEFILESQYKFIIKVLSEFALVITCLTAKFGINLPGSLF